jgi:hypothetical protein
MVMAAWVESGCDVLAMPFGAATGDLPGYSR